MEDKKREPSSFVRGLSRGKAQLLHRVAGTIRVPAAVGRNAACSCGSGKKFKKCCGKPKRPHAPPRRKITDHLLAGLRGASANAVVVDDATAPTDQTAARPDL